jgi:histidine triad (HIT) family protein
MEISPEQQKVLDEQKAQCPFCKIVSGEIPSKKVYEDDKILAILDINPATKGHTLVLPKEHYPIMPLIPQETFTHLFVKVKEIAQCIKDALLCPGVTVFIANGGAAGQQSSHFMIHIVPRDGNDGLNCFDIPQNAIEVGDILDPLKSNLNIMMNNHLTRMGKGKPEQKVTKKQLIATIESNPQLKEMMLNKTEEFKSAIGGNAQLQALFKDFNVDEIINELKGSNEKSSIDLDAVSAVMQKPEIQDAEIIEDKISIFKDLLVTNPSIIEKEPEKILEMVKGSEKYKEKLKDLTLDDIKKVLTELKPDDNKNIEDLC